MAARKNGRFRPGSIHAPDLGAGHRGSAFVSAAYASRPLSQERWVPSAAKAPGKLLIYSPEDIGGQWSFAW